ncbi:MAG: hypothetical protein PVG53_11640 [Holophagae bacterium]
MSSKTQVASLLLIVCACVASAQDEWVPYPGNPVIGPPASGTWESALRGVEGLVVVDGTYHLFFTATATEPFYDHAIGHATSPDGINWEMDPANPVLTPETEGSWHVSSLISAAVYHDGELFQMWYGGDDYSDIRVGYATSPDGTSWTRYSGNPVLSEGPAGSFDAALVAPNDVLYHDGLYRMWYGAAPNRVLTDSDDTIGYATSPDGVTWTRHPSPVLEPTEEWEGFMIYGVGVDFDGSIYRMWYPGYGYEGGERRIRIGVATSPDGIVWTRDPDNPIEELGDFVSQPQVVRDFDMGGYVMIYTHDDPFYTVLRATSTCCSIDTSMWIIPAAALASGSAGSFFQTDVDVNSTAPGPSMMPVSYRFLWLPRGQNNSDPMASEVFVLDPGESIRHENILAAVFGLAPNVLGSLAIAADSESLIAMSRTYNLPSAKTAGTFGQALPAVPFDELITTGESRRITFMSENADTRANLGCVNGTDAPVTIDIAEYDATGTVLETRTMNLPPWSNKQINQIFEDFPSVNGSIDVSTSTADAVFTCYGSVLDNVTSDPTSVLPQTPSASTMSFIPAAALSGGDQGSFFETDVDLNNAGDTMSSYSLLWLPRGENNSSPTASDTFTLEVGASVRYENALSGVFGLEPNAVGALALSTDAGNVLVMSRTYNIPSVKIAGTFGQALVGVPADRLLQTGEVGRIIFLTENDDIRSNLGCVNGGTNQITIDIAVYDATGTLLETRTMNLAAWSNKQINQILEDFAPVDGYVDVSSATPNATFTCYGSVLDNTTSDPTTIPPQ